MSRTRRSDDVLRKASVLLLYEYSMFRSLTHGLAQRVMPQGWPHNAVVEAWVVHLRALIDFVYEPRTVKADDVLALDFFNDPTEWTTDLPAMSQQLRRRRKRAGKEIVHLNYDRIGISHEEKEWHYVALAKRSSHSFSGLVA